MLRGVLLSAALFALAAPAAPQEQAASKAPPLPPIRSLLLEPDRLVLEDGRDARRILVWGVAASGQKFDLSASATLKSESPLVGVDAEGYVQPKAPGQARVAVSASGLKAALPVTVKSADLPPVRFVRDVLPVMGRVGCNQGTCHGSAQGKNGFKLSLRGYDPDHDYQALVYDIAGRRIDRVAPDSSLMLLKPTAQVPHEGRQVIKPGSRYYAILRSWIDADTPREAATARANRLEVLPAEISLDLPGRTQQVVILAHYPDGSSRDVTRESILSSSDLEIAEVKENRVTALRRGEASVLIRYEGNYETRLITVMGDRAGFAWKETPEYNFVDRHIHDKLRKLKTLPSDLCSDAEFIRRAWLDLAGMPPSPERTRAFLADPAPSRERRAKLVDELIGSPEFVEAWTNKWADLLQCNSEALGQKGVWAFRDWIRQSVAGNKPYDRFVRELLLAQGSSYYDPATNYLRVLREPGKITEDVSQTFLGVRFNCNRCHDHPFEKWTQNQYYEFGAFFARVAFKKGTLGSEIVRNGTGDMQAAGEEIVYRKYDGGEVKHPKSDKPVTPRVPFGQTRPADGEPDRRPPFVDWMTSKENPLFARALANRMWSYFFGRGIIDPVDDIRSTNPPSNPALLDALSDEFVKGGFDVRRLIRTIATSRTYQLSIRPDRWNEDDRINFARAYPRRLTAEQLMDAVAVATGVRPRFAGLPEGMRPVEVADGDVKGNDFLTLFGRPQRKGACECDRRTASFTLSHTLNLINGPTIGDAVTAPHSRIARLVEAEPDNAKLVEGIYLAILCRLPTDAERKAVDFPAGPGRLETAQDLAWALMNSPAFFFNR